MLYRYSNSPRYFRAIDLARAYNLRLDLDAHLGRDAWELHEQTEDYGERIVFHSNGA